MRARRILPLIALLAGSACSAPDYTPVRDWAAAASLAVDYPQAARRVAAPDDEGVLAMQQALATWLGALAVLATDGVLSFREDPFIALRQRLAPEDIRVAAAIASLGGQLRHATRSNAQAPQMRGDLAAADPAVQVLVTGLATAISRPAVSEAAARAERAAFYAGLAARSADPAARQTLAEWAALRDAEFAARAEARARAIAILGDIGMAHAAMARGASRITGAEMVALMREAEDALRRATAALPRPAAP